MSNGITCYTVCNGCHVFATDSDSLWLWFVLNRNNDVTVCPLGTWSFKFQPEPHFSKLSCFGLTIKSVYRKSAFLPTFSWSSFWLNSYRRDCYVSGLHCSRFVRTLCVLPIWLLVFVRVRFQAALFYLASILPYNFHTYGHYKYLDTSITLKKTIQALLQHRHARHARVISLGVGVDYLKHCKWCLYSDQRKEEY